jgi:sugar-specific transcriptional regulator TrmB
MYTTNNSSPNLQKDSLKEASQYLPVFERLGLNQHEAQIYELLLNLGPQGMKNILFHTKMKRGNAYYHLDNLIEKGLVEKQDLPKTTTKFVAKHPEHLELLLAKQKAAVFAAEEELEKNLPFLRNLFQSFAVRPTIKFYEGLEGAVKVAEDSLTSTTEIYSYIDNEAVNKLYPDINKAYVQKRKAKSIKKKMITIDSAFIRQHAKNFDPQLTEIRVLPKGNTFSTVMYIYDNRVSYIAAQKEKLISVIIEHPTIYQMHKTLFEALWQQAQKII